jgi:hypothetical protein
LVKRRPRDADNQTMNFELTNRTRLLALIGVLVAAAGGAVVLMLGRAHSSPAGTAALPPSLRTTPQTPATTNAKPDVGFGLPAAVAAQLGAGRVVVVSLYAPKASIDATAMREAAAGAGIAGAAFVAIDVNSSDVDELNRRYGAIQDPAVLVLRPPGNLIVRIDGFADRDTVAQAATNAGS